MTYATPGNTGIPGNVGRVCCYLLSCHIRHHGNSGIPGNVGRVCDRPPSYVICDTREFRNSGNCGKSVLLFFVFVCHMRHPGIPEFQEMWEEFVIVQVDMVRHMCNSL